MSQNGFRVLLLGREAFSCRTLEKLHASKDVCESLTVVTTADQRVGRRGKDISISPLKILAQSLDIPIHEIPPKPYDFQQWLPPHPFRAPHPRNMLITSSFGRAIPTTALEFFHETHRLNVHASLLPRYRGGAPIQRAIAQGAERTGISIVQMEEIGERGFDTGPVWQQESIPIPPDATYLSLEATLGELGGNLLVKTLRDMLDGKASSIPQDDSQATRARLISPKTALVNWSTWDASRVERYHRAIGHQRSLLTVLPSSGLSLKLRSITLPPASYNPLPVLSNPGDSAYDPTAKAIAIRCADGRDVYVHTLQTENRNAIDANAWWNGTQQRGGVLKLGLP